MFYDFFLHIRFLCKYCCQKNHEIVGFLLHQYFASDVNGIYIRVRTIMFIFICEDLKIHLL